MRFNEALATLMKSIGLQIANIAEAHGLKLRNDLQRIAPLKV